MVFCIENFLCSQSYSFSGYDFSYFQYYEASTAKSRTMRSQAAWPLLVTVSSPLSPLLHSWPLPCDKKLNYPAGRAGCHAFSCSSPYIPYASDVKCARGSSLLLQWSVFKYRSQVNDWIHPRLLVAEVFVSLGSEELCPEVGYLIQSRLHSAFQTSIILQGLWLRQFPCRKWVFFACVYVCVCVSFRTAGWAKMPSWACQWQHLLRHSISHYGVNCGVMV